MKILLWSILLLGSGIAYADLGYGFAVIILGLLFLTILEYWNNKTKPPKNNYTNENGLGI